MLPAVSDVLALLPPREEIEDIVTRRNIEKEEEECSSDRIIAGLALRTGDSAMNTIDYFECRKMTYPIEMSVDTNNAPVVETIPPQACPHNRVLGGFNAYSGDSSTKRWINPPVLQGICYLLKNFLVDYSRCNNVTASSGPWIGVEDKDETSSTWDTIFYCPVGSLAIGLSREQEGNNYRIKNLMCCFVEPQEQ